MSQQFSNLQDLHTKLWNNANNVNGGQDNNDQKRKIYTGIKLQNSDGSNTIGRNEDYYIFRDNGGEENNVKVEDMNGGVAQYGIPWDIIKQGWIKVKASLDEVWWIYNPRAGSRGGRKKTRRKKRRKKKTKKRRKSRRRKKKKKTKRRR